jgi:hypothetical protein
MTRSADRTPEQPFAQKKYLDINGHRMAYIDEGEGAPMPSTPTTASSTSSPFEDHPVCGW